MIQLQRLGPNEGAQARAITGVITGTLYTVDQLGRVTVDATDAPYLIVKGWQSVIPGATGATSGLAVIDFGAFPGTPTASVTVAGVADPNAVLDAWIVPVATDDHSADEHTADPPLVSAVADGNGNIVITGLPSGRDLIVQPGVAFGKASSQMPVGQQQLMPVGKWSVGWAFAQ